MKTKYPKYRVSEWLDTSPESFALPELRMLYGVQTQRRAHGPWLHTSINGKAVIFDSLEKASKTCDELRSQNSKMSNAGQAAAKQDGR